jgi:hypothetical protein
MSGVDWARTFVVSSVTTPTLSSSTRVGPPWGRACSSPKRAGTIVTCAATSGYMIEYDNRHLWMKLKTIKGSHFANYREAWSANQTIMDGKVVPPLSAVFELEQTGEATRQLQHNQHEGKIGILCAAPREGLGVTDPELRARIGEELSRSFVATTGVIMESLLHRDRSRRDCRQRPRGRNCLVWGGFRRDRRAP